MVPVIMKSHHIGYWIGMIGLLKMTSTLATRVLRGSDTTSITSVIAGATLSMIQESESELTPSLPAKSLKPAPPIVTA